MKKTVFIVSAALVALFCALICACKQSDAAIVGNYRLFTVSGDNGVNKFEYYADGRDKLINENSFTLEIKSNYKWKMNIMLPGISETEDGTWKDENGTYSLIEDKDDPEIVLSVNDGTIKFNIVEDGYLMAVTLIKV